MVCLGNRSDLFCSLQYLPHQYGAPIQKGREVERLPLRREDLYRLEPGSQVYIRLASTVWCYAALIELVAGQCEKTIRHNTGIRS